MIDSGVAAGGGAIALTPITFGLSENLLVGKFLSKNAKFCASYASQQRPSSDNAGCLPLQQST